MSDSELSSPPPLFPNYFNRIDHDNNEEDNVSNYHNYLDNNYNDNDDQLTRINQNPTINQLNPIIKSTANLHNPNTNNHWFGLLPRFIRRRRFGTFFESEDNNFIMSSGSSGSFNIVSALSTWQYQVPLLAAFGTLLWLGLKFWRSIREQQIRIIPASWNGIHTHQWSLIQCLTHRATCCICQSLIVDAMFCDSCGVCLDFACFQLISTSYIDLVGTKKKKSGLATLGQCKTISRSKVDDKKDQQKNPEDNQNCQWSHHWIHGNLPEHSKCYICQEYCDEMVTTDDQDTIQPDDHTLYHYRCCWCQRTVDEHCYERQRNTARIDGQCDFGRWRRFIIPPNCVIHKRVWSSRGRRAILLDEIKDFGIQQSDWEPLIVIASKKSGNNDGGKILSQFLTVLNPLQVVVDVNQTSIEFGLEICRMLPRERRARILVAGGDGTICWVLNTIHQLKLNPIPPVAIIPLGTGNDLSRVLGWGTGTIMSSSNDHNRNGCHELLSEVYRAQVVDIDRWNVDIQPTDYYHKSRNLLLSRLRIPESIMPAGTRTLFVYNYFSIGVDALVTLNFHETRKSSLYKFLFSNTLINKFIYFTYGTRALWERRCKNLHTKVQLELDDVPVELPSLESIVFQNIPSYAGGGQLLPESEQSVPDDGVMEILGLTSSFHIGQVMLGLSKAIFLGRARKVRLVLNEHLPIQADGEPSLQSPAVIEMTTNSRAKLLRNSPDVRLDSYSNY